MKRIILIKKVGQLALCLFLLTSVAAYSQITVNSLSELLPYLEKDNVDVKLAPGIYSITVADVAKGLYKQELNIKSKTHILLLFKGNNSTYDFTGVTINIETKVHQAYGNNQVHELQIIGNHNVLKNLTMVDNGSVYDAPNRRATNIVMDGAHNRIEGFHVTTKGSFPYGYGDAFGKGGNTVIKHQKHSACLIRGESNHLKNSTFIHKSYGHCIFMQGANNPLIEGCVVEGEVRKTDDMLAEKGTGSPADKVDFLTVWGYTLPAGYMLSTGEAGIRAYNGGETIIDGKTYNRGTSNPTVLNCTIKYMRTGVTLAHATGKIYVEGCVAIGCENGFSLGTGNAVNCSADCTYGPVYASTYENDKNYNADITILPASHPYYNGSGNVAYIGGSGHHITFRGTDEAIKEGLKIKVGGDKNNIRLLNGNLPNQNDFKGFSFELNNFTNYPVYLSEKSSGIKVESKGKVIDLGSSNHVTYKVISTKK
ncbi:right-handed parallel beta-helix repeat-containing protein [Polaribacter vadi]|uniref:right-handed parallel beta-helix repeat-containing protein n=1 Tax=Polaribacter vadi TaxID=1774273 RepID=UPI0030EC9AF2|tara:strand:+ start:48630 stop:50072 length:1443 start_codon:yes stop_codon:yes gene_type:complete